MSNGFAHTGTSVIIPFKDDSVEKVEQSIKSFQALNIGPKGQQFSVLVVDGSGRYAEHRSTVEGLDEIMLDGKTASMDELMIQGATYAREHGARRIVVCEAGDVEMAGHLALMDEGSRRDLASAR